MGVTHASLLEVQVPEQETSPRSENTMLVQSIFLHTRWSINESKTVASKHVKCQPSITPEFTPLDPNGRLSLALFLH